jgi:hypothetical protein
MSDFAIHLVAEIIGEADPLLSMITTASGGGLKGRH